MERVRALVEVSLDEHAEMVRDKQRRGGGCEDPPRAQWLLVHQRRGVGTEAATQHHPVDPPGRQREWRGATRSSTDSTSVATTKGWM